MRESKLTQELLESQSNSVLCNVLARMIFGLTLLHNGGICIGDDVASQSSGVCVFLVQRTQLRALATTCCSFSCIEAPQSSNRESSARCNL